MQKILYRDNPYIVLWYNLNLQAFRTDAWSGYAHGAGRGGAPFWNFMRATYIGLRPLETRPAGDRRVPRRGRGCERRGRRRWS